MFSSLGTKIAMKKLGIPKDALNFTSPAAADTTPPRRASKRGTRSNTIDGDEAAAGGEAGGEEQKSWPKWMTAKSLPMTVQPWLSPAPPPVPVAAEPPRVGDVAPADQDGKLVVGRGRKVVVVFLRCVGCAFAQNTFLSLRELSNKLSNSNITCIAISHASPAATKKWLDLIGGPWKVQVLIDEDRAIYAAWGLGVSTVWYYFNPATQAAAWREKGWLGAKVAASVGRRAAANLTGEDGGDGVPGMGNKWQQGGAFAVDERGVVVWGGKARSADDLMDLEAGFKALVG
ncbi:hypothetical protein M406DRAFT_260138 [Cryphonectria parasitica EP155]|uniref:Alkyl hydroperoxide reductase subunit C/ Thiol specific antioxidant domain-containing protein n=1 Tax=Cryphonectria parasitica (strain ATCC 38755 / EP155) TaxID=660469 RepID=A0A9P5CPH3_CRYP1|nr:uncharacterized protein M406DRAFT_260138 [Cryphonectria parasitica EP155]KAF3765171.1 hypothetical protein M406DRAFT_260138 [Cryphonectria parasitica EP155]